MLDLWSGPPFRAGDEPEAFVRLFANLGISEATTGIRGVGARNTQCLIRKV